MNASSNCPIYVPQTRPCGSFGECYEISDAGNVELVCVCQDGFSQKGDFSIAISNPCDIYVAAIQGLWAVVLISVILAIGTSIWGILSRRAAKVVQWSAWRLWIVPYLVIVQSTLVFIICIGKLVQPTVWNLGEHLPMTLLHAFQALITVTFMVVALAGVARTVYIDHIRGKSSSDRLAMKVRMRRLESAIACFWLLAAGSAFLPVASIINPDYVFWVAGIHGGIFALDMLVLGSIIAPYQFGMVMARVKESVQNNISRSGAAQSKLQKVLLKMKVAKRVATYGFTFASVFVVIYVVWPFLLIKIAYGLPFLYILIEVCAASLIWVTTTTSALQFRRPSQGLKRLSQALASATPSLRKSLERRSTGGMMAADKRSSVEKSLLPSATATVANESSQ